MSKEFENINKNLKNTIKDLSQKNIYNIGFYNKFGYFIRSKQIISFRPDIIKAEMNLKLGADYED